MFNKLICLLTAAALTVCVFTGCAPAPKDNGTPLPPAAETDQTPEKEPAGTPSPKPGAPEEDKPAQKPEENPADRPTDKPAEKPADRPTGKPEEKPAQKPDAKPAVSCADIWSAVAKALGNKLGTMASLDDAMLQDMYGIAPGDLTDYVGKIPQMATGAEEFFIARVKDGKLDAVKAGIASRVAASIQSMEAYFPDQVTLLKSHQVIVNGSYLFFVVSENADTAVETFEKLTK